MRYLKIPFTIIPPSSAFKDRISILDESQAFEGKRLQTVSIQYVKARKMSFPVKNPHNIIFSL